MAKSAAGVISLVRDTVEGRVLGLALDLDILGVAVL